MPTATFTTASATGGSPSGSLPCCAVASAKAGLPRRSPDSIGTKAGAPFHACPCVSYGLREQRLSKVNQD